MTAVLADGGLRVLAPSRPGYLGTPLDVGRSPADQADALTALLDHLGAGQSAVVGMSGGGPVALQMALRHAERVRALVLASAFTRRYAVPGSALARRLFLSDAAGWLLRRVFERSPAMGTRALIAPMSTLKGRALASYLQSIAADPSALRVLRQVAGTMTSLSRRRVGMENDFAQLAVLADLPLGRIRCPVLVIHGRADGNVPFGHAEYVAASVSGAELVAVEQGSHICQIGPGSAAANERMIAFLREN
jgi:pimeloyl-ACP methyl ester carboxylesterase